MTQTEFNKLTPGSIVGFVAYPQFQGTVLATYVDTPEPMNMVIVDLPPNNITQGYDPKPQPIKAEYLTVVKYAEGGNIRQEIPAFVITTLKAMGAQLDTVKLAIDTLLKMQ